MISASHNPYQDNGIKVFDHSGFKLPDDDEHQLEERIFAIVAGNPEMHPAELTVDEGLDEAYLSFLADTMSTRLDGIRLLIDSANGAASQLAPRLFSSLGAEVETIGCSPDGRNINLNCGALHTETLAREVVQRGLDAGLAFDGDADRCILVAPSGRIVDGDAVLLIAGKAMAASGKLSNPMVV